MSETRTKTARSTTTTTVVDRKRFTVVGLNIVIVSSKGFGAEVAVVAAGADVRVGGVEVRDARRRTEGAPSIADVSTDGAGATTCPCEPALPESLAPGRFGARGFVIVALIQANRFGKMGLEEGEMRKFFGFARILCFSRFGALASKDVCCSFSFSPFPFLHLTCIRIRRRGSRCPLLLNFN